MSNINFTFRPITDWPRKATLYPKRAPFRTQYRDVLALLDKEISKAGATKAVIQAYIREYDLRIDGQMRSNSSPSRPGVIIAFDGNHGPIQMPCDAFDHWKDNLYAIARSLEALRMVDRYGVTQNGEQYRGWKALPAVGDDLAGAALFVAKTAGMEARAKDVESDPAAFAIAYRAAVRKAHPDAGGDVEVFHNLQACAAVLRQKHEGRS